MERPLLAAFAELVQAHEAGPVAVEVARLLRQPHDDERFQQAHLLVRKPQEP